MEETKGKPQNGNSLTPDEENDNLNKQNLIESKPKQSFWRTNLLTILTLLGVVFGIALGFVLREVKTWTKREIMYVSFPGEVFLNMLKCLILPLIVSSLVSALGSLDVRLSGKIGIRAVVYYLGTTVLAIILGIILVIAIRPGVGGGDADFKVTNRKTKPTLTEDTLMDLIKNMFPPNIIDACIHQYSTVLSPPDPPVNESMTTDMAVNDSMTTDMGQNDTLKQNETTVTEPDYRTWKIGHRMVDGTNILGLVVFSVVLGITLGRMENAGKPLLAVFTSLSDAMMIITKLVIWLSPVGVLFLVAGKILEMEDIKEIAGKVGLYTVTVLVGLFLHGLVVLPLIYFFFVRKLPFVYIANMSQALATAFGTSSSSATLPVTIACLEDKNNVDPRISRFCLPIGATINMDGTALYEAVAAIFIAQTRKLPLTLGNIVGISITATAASIGAAGIPQAGLVTMVMVLNVLSLPAEDVALILVVDWFLDRCRTTITVLGDAFGSGIVARLSVKDLENIKAQENEQIRVEMTPL